MFDDWSCAVVREDALRRVQELKAERMSALRSLGRFLVVADGKQAIRSHYVRNAMSDMMHALVVTELGKQAELRQMPRPRAAHDEVLIKTWHSGVSVGTEMWIASGRRKDYGEPPFINGYQASGEIVELGEQVVEFELGDVVTVFCSGAHAEYAKAPVSLTHKLADPSLAQGAALFVQPAVGANALNQATVNTGDTLLVTGQGLIGQCTAILARLRGAYVIASDISPERLAVARANCADWVIDAATTTVADAVLQRFPDGLDVVIESTGFQALLDDALRCCRHQGRFVFEGFYPDQVSYTFALPHDKQLRAFYPCFIGSRASQASVIRLMALGLLDMRPLISHTPSWKECEATYNALFTPARNQCNGIVIDWTA
ncbi:MAG TPA: zinc-binding dehydrogenase [Herpetosiphonaceae bacterium]|nr:zinc-binding dehydrogenase [Herpetosiphonaceae bacterium]